MKNCFLCLNIIVSSSANKACVVLVSGFKSDMNKLKSVGPKDEPYGIPDSMFLVEDLTLLTLTQYAVILILSV